MVDGGGTPHEHAEACYKFWLGGSFQVRAKATLCGHIAGQDLRTEMLVKSIQPAGQIENAMPFWAHGPCHKFAENPNRDAKRCGHVVVSKQQLAALLAVCRSAHKVAGYLNSGQGRIGRALLGELNSRLANRTLPRPKKK